MIRSATTDDAAAIAAIYNHYVDNTIITFEEEAVSDSVMKDRIARGLSSAPWLVAEAAGAILGYAYAAPWSARSGYKLTAETTVYVGRDHLRAGHGSALYAALIEQLRSRGLHAAIGIIALPNPASVALHERLGYQKVAQLREIGRKFDRWIEVGCWQLLL